MPNHLYAEEDICCFISEKHIITITAVVATTAYTQKLKMEGKEYIQVLLLTVKELKQQFKENMSLM
jgi:hypothetical protein